MMQTETQSDAPNTEAERAHTSTPAQAGLYSWYVVLLCMVAYIFSFIDRQILALMIEPIKADLHISDTISVRMHEHHTERALRVMISVLNLKMLRS